ncbi:MAG: GTP-binding protein [Massiliimalia sp.]|jgi:ribosomal protection tetracycline resistance protein
MAEILNVGIVAHVDAGKTTVTEQILYQSGAVRRAGRVDEGTAQTDFLEVERMRGISVRASSVSVMYQGKQLNLIDTPGHVDFVAEVERSLSVLDMGILVVSASEGIQSHTELLYHALRSMKTGTMVFLNKIDLAGSHISEILRDLKERFQLPVLLCSQVEGEGTKDCRTALCDWEDPEFYEQVCEVLCESDDQLMEQYLSGEKIPVSELQQQFQNQLAQGRFLPVLCGSGLLGIGILDLLDFLVSCCGDCTKTKQGDALSGMVYQVSHDKTMGRIAHVRLFEGSLKNRDSIVLSSQPEPVKITQIRRYMGSRFVDLGEAKAGDVVALCGMSQVRVGDILGTCEEMTHCSMAVPVMRVSVVPKQTEQLYLLFSALEEICAEDPQLDLEYYPEEQEINIHIMGKIQLEILQEILRQRYDLEVSFSAPTVIYKETPARKGVGLEEYTMPKPCWAIIQLEIEPAAPGSGLEYHSVVPNDQIFYRYQHHIETELPRALKQGLYNWEVTDLKVTLIGGSHHTVHTHPMDFFLATPLAVMNGLEHTGTVLLEPIQMLRIWGPEEYLGKVIGDMVAMRGEYDSPVIQKGEFVLEAKVPVEESVEYAIRLASMTSGKAHLSARFLEYAPCPPGMERRAKRHGVDPRNREQWILSRRNAMSR